MNHAMRQEAGMYGIGADGKLTGARVAPPQAPAPVPHGQAVTYLPQFFSGDQIAAIFDEIAGLTFEEAQLGGGAGSQSVMDEVLRKSLTAWLPGNSLAGLMMAGAAKASADTPLHNWEVIQVACYGPGQFFEWHTDAGDTPESYCQRKWSAVAELQSAPGAGLEIEGQPTFDLGPGGLIVFPARAMHRATAPTEGLRFSLTAWFW